MELDKAIDSMVKINSEIGIPQGIYVMEECSELIKALVKEERGKRNREEIIDESCDVLTAIAILLKRMDVHTEEIKKRMVFKCSRAVERWENKKEA